MARSQKIGELEVVISGNDSKLTSAKNRSIASMKAIDDHAKNISKTLSASAFQVAPWLTLAGGVLAVGRALKSIADEAKAMDALRLQTGISAQAIGELKQIADQADVSFNTLSASVVAFNAAIREAAADSKSAAAEAFAQLGISLKDSQGQFTTFDQALPRLADRFANWSDGVGKASIAQALFGQGAVELTRILNQGNAALEKQTTGVDAIGRSYEEAQRKNMEFAKAISDLDRGITMLRDEALLPLLPIITSFVTNFSGGLRLLKQDLANFRMEKVKTEILDTAKNIRFLTEEEDKLLEKLRELAATNNDQTSAPFVKLNNQLQALREKMREQIDLHEQLQAQITTTNNTWQTTTTPVDRRPKPREVGLKQNNEGLELLKKDIEDLEAKLMGLPNYFDEAFTVNRTTFDDVRSAIDTVTAAYSKQGDVVREMHRMKLELMRKEQDVAMETAQMAAQLLTTLFSKSKAAAIGSAIINTAVGVTKAFRDVPWPWNIAQAAMVAATGAAQIASIRSASASGGGSATGAISGGGGGGGVNVEGESSSSVSRSLTIQGVDRAALYSGDVVAELIKQINSEVQNGATLIATRNVTL